MKEVKLGQKVQDQVTGLIGIVTGIGYWPNMCRRISVQPPLNKKTGAVPESEDFDEPQLKILEEKPVVAVQPTRDALYEFGQEGYDTYSGFKGKIVSRCIYIHGCARVCLQSQDGSFKDQTRTMWVNELHFKPTGKILKPAKGEKQEEKAKKSSGGPTSFKATTIKNG